MRTCFALLAFLMVGCKPTPAPVSNASGISTSDSGVDQQSSEAAIRNAESRWRKILTARDTAAIKSFYTEDAVYAPQGDPHYQGRDSVSARWSGEFMSPGFGLERTPLRIEVAKSGDVANEVGTYQVRYRTKAGPQQESGTYMTAWRKEGGDWKISSYMWNRSKPERMR